MTKTISKSNHLRYHSHRLWQRLITTATILAVLIQIGLPLSNLSIAPVAQAATFEVDRTDDDATATACTVAPNDCSLRGAIIAANAAAGDDEITLPAGTYNLTISGTGENAAATGDFDITGADNLTINGAGVDTTIIDGQDLDRVFHYLGTGTLELNDLTVQNGRTNASGQDGGGIFNAATGTINLNNSIVTDNEVAFNGEDGGGIANTGGGAVNITNSTISNNRVIGATGPSTASGGGLFHLNGGTITIVNSTISGNTATDRGGAIYSGQPLTLTNSTISGNTAANGTGGGLDISQGSVTTLNNVTIFGNTSSGNGGGIFNAGEPGTVVNLGNSIVAGNTSGGTGNDCNGTLTSVVTDPNLIGDGAGCTLGAGDIIDGTVAGLMSSLANNGGATQTHALQPLNPAIDSGGFNCEATDQRGVATVDVPNFGGIPCDVGAYEFNSLPGIQVLDNSVIEGDSPGVNLTFTIELTVTIDTVVTVDYSTIDTGSATGAGGDYTDTSGTITFPANTITQTVDVPITGDTALEPSETFELRLTAGTETWARISDSTGVGTILDNDQGVVTISDAPAVTEGNPPDTVTASFPVNLSVANTQPVTVTYQTVDDSAVGGSDFTSVASGQLVFAAGEQNKTIDITVLGDTAVEGTETFFVQLTNVQGGPSLGGITQGVGTINDDDNPAPLPTISISNASVIEGGAGTQQTLTFNVALSTASTNIVQVNYSTADGSAKTGEDYEAKSGTLSFPVGSTSQSLVVTILGDGTVEGNETFTVNLTNPVNATIADGQATGTISNDDSQSGGSNSDDDDDDDDNSAAPPPAPATPPASVAPAPPAASGEQLPVSTLPETGFKEGSTPTFIPWWITVSALFVTIVLGWNLRRYRQQKI